MRNASADGWKLSAADGAEAAVLEVGGAGVVGSGIGDRDAAELALLSTGDAAAPADPPPEECNDDADR